MVALPLCVLACVLPHVLAPGASEAHHHHPASPVGAHGSCGWGEGLGTHPAARGSGRAHVGSGRDAPRAVLALWLG